MKYIFLFLLFPTICFSQQKELNEIFPLKDGRVYYELIADVADTKNDALKRRAKSWMADQSWTQPAVQEVDNSEHTLLTANADLVLVFMIPINGKNELKSQMSYLYTVKVSLKDNKSKIVIDNIRLAGPTPNSYIPIEEFKSSLQSLYKGFNKRTMNRFYIALTENYIELNKSITEKIFNLQKALQTETNF